MSDEQNQLPDDGSPPGHIEKMLGKAKETQEAPVDETPADEQQVAQRPDNIPEKFWDAEKGAVNTEALLKAQQDAEAALRKAQQGDTPENEGNETPNEGNETPEDTSNQTSVVANASAEWDEKGELSEGTLKSLEGVGVSREMVAMYINGMQAVVSNLQSAAYGPFEGKDGYEAAANWAAENLSESEIKAIDVQLTSNNPDIVAEGAKALARRFQEEGPNEPHALRGGGNAGVTGDAYQSRSEMIRDMGDPRYRRDPAFRKRVEDKLRRSNLPRG